MAILRILRALFVFTLLVSTTELAASCPHKPKTEDIWRQLVAGNKRFVNNKKYARQRAKLVDGQNPPCVVLSCSDSRVPPELVFDQGLGKLFVARVAGNVVDDVVTDSIQFAVATWDIFSIVVLGHTDCGAVEGALARLRKNGGVIDPVNGFLFAVLNPIEHAIVNAGIDIYASNALKLATRANIAQSANQLFATPSIAKAVKDGKVNIIGAEYNLKTGKVKELFVID